MTTLALAIAILALAHFLLVLRHAHREDRREQGFRRHVRQLYGGGE